MSSPTPPGQPQYPQMQPEPEQTYSPFGSPEADPSQRQLFPPPAYPAHQAPSQPLRQPSNQQIYPHGVAPALPGWQPNAHQASGYAPYSGAPSGPAPVPPGAGFGAHGFPPPVTPSPSLGMFKRLKAWQWIALGVGALFLACCVCSAFVVVLNPGNSNRSGNQQSSRNTNTSNAPSVSSGTMDLGHGFGQNTQGFYIIDQTSQFASTDEFAFVVTLSSGLSTTQAQLLLVQVESGGVETVVRTVPESISNPNFTTFALKFTTASLMLHSATGLYKLELSNGQTVVAEASFTYLG